MTPGRFVYHGAPATLVGDRLVSLFALEQLDPAAYANAMAKYAGREEAPYVPIPGLGVRFNDTIHCAPIHPWFLRRARIEEGVEPASSSGPSVTRQIYRIPIEALLGSRMVWYRAETLWVNGAPGDDVPTRPPDHEFEPFDAERYRELTAVPEAYRAHLRRCMAEGRRALMFVHIPHVLVAGSIDLASATLIDPDVPPDWVRTATA